MSIALIGSGSWGTAVAGQLAPRTNQVRMWALEPDVVAGIHGGHVNPRYLTDYRLPDNVVATGELSEALEGADGVVLASPSAFVRATARSMAPHLPAETPVLVLAKGLDPDTGELMTEVVADEVGCPGRIAALSGPNHAEEVCRGSLSASVIASPSEAVTEFFKRLLLTREFRVYASSDMVGVEVCGAVKNVVALICGMAVGYGYGDNTLALIMTRGLAEISRLVAAKGGDPMTCMGLAGMGDLVVTCTSPHSRNRTFGELFAREGVTLEEYRERTHMVVEGALAAKSVARLARELEVDAPITFAVNAVLWEGAGRDEAFHALVDRFPTEEFYTGIKA